MNYSDLTIWVVEDDLPSWGVISRLLEAIGVKDFTVTMNADTVHEAISKGLAIDIILIDVHLQGDNGYDLLNFLQNNPNTQKTKSVMISASSGPSGVRQAQLASADGFIGKPLTMQKLRTAFNAILNNEPFWG